MVSFPQPPTTQAPWSPTAHAFAHHQFSQVVNFWMQGRQASIQLEALPGGQAKLNLTFQLPSASEVIPPPSHVPPAPAPQRPMQPLFPKGCFPQGFSAESKTKPASWRQRKNYWRSVLHRAASAASTLPPPKNGSLRQAAQTCVQRLQADSASRVNTESARKRPFSPSTPSSKSQSPLAQKIRADLHISECEVDSPERECLRSQPPEKSPSPSSPPSARGFPSPAPLVLTPAKKLESRSCLNCDVEMAPDHQCEVGKPNSDLDTLPLCLYCCHPGSGNNPVHFSLVCLCSDRVCTCRCYCCENQMKLKRLKFSHREWELNSLSDEQRAEAHLLACSLYMKHYDGLPCTDDMCTESG